MGEIPELEADKLTPEPSTCLSLRVFYPKLSRCEWNESMLDTLTITHTPLTFDPIVEANGDRSITNDGGQVSCPLHRDHADAVSSREATFVSMETMRMTGSVRFEVRVGKDEKLLVGIMEMCNVSDGFSGVEKNGCWVMKCQVSMQRGSGFLKGGREDTKSPMIEVYVVSMFRGNPIVFTMAMNLRFRRRRQVKAPFMEPIPECGKPAEDAKEMAPADHKHDPQNINCEVWTTSTKIRKCWTLLYQPQQREAIARAAELCHDGGDVTS